MVGSLGGGPVGNQVCHFEPLIAQQKSRRRGRAARSMPTTRFGRTAIMMTGEPRSLSVPFYTGIHYDKMLNSPEAIRLMQTKPATWAGARQAAFGDNVMATAFHNNLFEPLSRYGGYDLFILQQRSCSRQPGGCSGSHKHPSASEFEVLRSHTLNALGVANGFHLRFSNLTAEIPFVSSHDRWRRFFYSKSRGITGVKAHAFIESMLIMNWLVYECNAWANEHAAKKSTPYRYKMRIRPDSLVMLPIPPPHELEAELLDRRTVFVPDPRFCPNSCILRSEHF